jgi:hypothetical protein
VTFWVIDWLRAFALTVLVELLVVAPLSARVEPRLQRRLAAIVLVNLATHPLVRFLFPGLRAPRAISVPLSEAWAVGAEAWAYTVIWPALATSRAAIISLLANGASFAAGLLLGTLFR